jgi:quinoprotein glucose dehydrogenase
MDLCLLLRDLNLPPLGYSSRPVPLVTASLLFLGEGSNVIGGTSGEYQWGTKFRAYQKSTGEVIWETELASGTTAAPMTYKFQDEQYIVVSIAGREHPPE